MSCPSWQWHGTGYSWSPVRTLPSALAPAPVGVGARPHRRCWFRPAETTSCCRCGAVDSRHPPHSPDGRECCSIMGRLCQSWGFDDCRSYFCQPKWSPHSNATAPAPLSPASTGVFLRRPPVHSFSGRVSCIQCLNCWPPSSHAAKIARMLACCLQSPFWPGSTGVQCVLPGIIQL